MNNGHTEHILLTAVPNYDTAYGFRLMGNPTEISETEKNKCETKLISVKEYNQKILTCKQTLMYLRRISNTQ
jgi:hypothetical protein